MTTPTSARVEIESISAGGDGVGRAGGMVIFVPPGSAMGSDGKPTDPTRDPGFYDATAEYLQSLGILTI